MVKETEGADQAIGTDRAEADIAEIALCINALFCFDCLGHFNFWAEVLKVKVIPTICTSIYSVVFVVIANA